MNNIERKLRATLYRAFCPDSTELGEYHLGLLSTDRLRELRAHLAECPHCTRELEQLRSFMESVSADIEPNLKAGQDGASLLQRLVARLLPPSIPGAGWSPALAGVRGETGSMLSFSAEGYHIVIDIQVDADRPDRRSIMGLLTSSQPDSAALIARLYQANALAAQAQVDELGNFAIHMVSPGEYSLLLSSPEIEISIEQLTIA
jgi:anti-sigma factor RsiW